ncbi:DUF4129 domain-containing protein [Nocardia halotolerans]|uniref:DUF4129 domain-containing protein n=1 Tax=Nocardia halotolerans TaxID=1755878 RepID=A0ABV8VAF5_9NOCA
MGGWAVATARVMAMLALVAAAIVALHGRVPGAEIGAARAPSALTVALMPVLLLVSVVILLSGVVISQHRLPLARPHADPVSLPRLRVGRLAVLAPLALGATAVIFAVGLVTLMVVPGADPEPAPEPAVPDRGGPEPAPVDAGTPESAFGPADLTGSAVAVVVGAAVVLIGLAIVGLSAAATTVRRTRRPAPEPEPELDAPEVDALTRAAEMGLAAMIAPGQDPRGAIIACYVAMERGLSADRAAAPLISDTPNEVLARAFQTGVLTDATAARELVTLFEEARFSPHSMLAWQRIRAEQSLRAVLADLQRREADG